jgi:hypothetical protein
MHDMTTLIEAARQALEALDTAYYQTCSVGRQKDWHQITKAIAALRTAIEQAEKQEPVATNKIYVTREQLAEIYPAPAAPVQEPVAWRYKQRFLKPHHNEWYYSEALPEHYATVAEPLYTTPPAAQRQWVGLTPEEVKYEWEAWRASLPRYSGFAKGIEAKLREKNAA